MDSGAKGVGDALRDGLGDWLGSLLGDGLRGRCLDCVTSMGVEMGAASMWAHSAENAEDNSSSVQPAISLGRAAVGAAGAKRLWLLGGTACHCRGRRRGDAQLWWMGGVR